MIIIFFNNRVNLKKQLCWFSLKYSVRIRMIISRIYFDLRQVKSLERRGDEKVKKIMNALERRGVKFIGHIPRHNKSRTKIIDGQELGKTRKAKEGQGSLNHGTLGSEKVECINDPLVELYFTIIKNL